MDLVFRCIASSNSWDPGWSTRMSSLVIRFEGRSCLCATTFLMHPTSEYTVTFEEVRTNH